MLERKMTKTAAVVLSAGKGTRMGTSVPKQYIIVGGFPIIYYSLKAFEESFIDEVVLVCSEGDEEFCRREIVEKYGFSKVSQIVGGGKQRYHSVLNGLRALKENCPDIVFIHDGARPFVDEEILRRAFEETKLCKATVTAVPSKDTVKISDADGYAVHTPNRDTVWIVQTPQTFDYIEILNAYEKLIASEAEVTGSGVMITDDAMVMEQFGNSKVKFVMGNYKNIKVTTKEDISVMESYLR